MAALKKSPAIELFWKIHPKIYRWTRGLVGGTLMNLPVLLLTTTGRRTGQPRTRALMHVPKGDSWVVIASYMGEPRHPDWWLNLKANPKAEVEIRGERIPVVAREAEGEERAQLWNEVVALQGDYTEYQERTKRRIPVVVLERRAS